MSLEDICSEIGVGPAIGSQLVQDGWNVNNFGMIASDVNGFEAALEELLPGQDFIPAAAVFVESSFSTLQTGGKTGK